MPYGQQLTIERGVITFAGPIDNPQAERARAAQGPGAWKRASRSWAPPRARKRAAGVIARRAGAGEALVAHPRDAGAADSNLSDSRPDARRGARAARQLAGIGPHEQARHSRTSGSAARMTNSVLGVLPESTVAGRTGTLLGGGRRASGDSINRQDAHQLRAGLSGRRGSAARDLAESRASSRCSCARATCRAWTLVYRWTLQEVRR